MNDPARVHRVALPVSRPFTGRYALFQPLGSGRVPNDEDHLLVARSLGGTFRATFGVYVPFDEEPLQVWDDVARPELCLLYHRYYLALSNNGGEKFNIARWERLHAIEIDRFGAACILDARVDESGDAVLANVYRGTQQDWRFSMVFNKAGSLESWRFDLLGNEEPRLLTSTLAVIDDTFMRTARKVDTAALLRTDGSRLYARSSPTDPFKLVPLMDCAEQFAREGTLDFFGGGGSRHFFP